jgi:hypothetical protein
MHCIKFFIIIIIIIIIIISFHITPTCSDVSTVILSGVHQSLL